MIEIYSDKQSNKYSTRTSKITNHKTNIKSFVNAFRIGNVISYINDKNVFLSRSFKTVTLSSPGNHLLQLCEKYISDYISYNNLDLHDVYLRYLHFISQYSNDLENFKNTENIHLN